MFGDTCLIVDESFQKRHTSSTSSSGPAAWKPGNFEKYYYIGIYNGKCVAPMVIQLSGGISVTNCGHLGVSVLDCSKR